MTDRPGNHVQCDSCNAVTSEGLSEWETLTGEGQRDAHLCPRCIERRERGELASNPLGLVCVRCGRTPADGIKQWWVAHGDHGEASNVCEDCFDEEHDSLVL
jgi:hypothetical protein